MRESRPVEGPVTGQVDRSTVTSQVYRQLRDGLMSGRFAPGQKLTIRGLADEFGSSAMPVREALQRLQVESAIHISDTGRIRVASLTPAQFREVRDARILLEGTLAEKAAGLMRAADLAEIRTVFDAMDAAVGIADEKAYLWTNFAFHRRIYQAADSELTLRVVESFWLLVGPAFTLLTPDAGHLRRSQVAHRAIIEALERTDGAAARAAVTDDITQAAASLERLRAASDAA